MILKQRMKSQYKNESPYKEIFIDTFLKIHYARETHKSVQLLAVGFVVRIT